MLSVKLLNRRNLLLISRNIHSPRVLQAIQAFKMPAMSPTMEMGGIVEWKYKVGEPFNAGDVILEIETDKAQIDVEAQDDGKFAAIKRDNGSKDVKVGEVVAYIAEVDDDLSTLEIPKDEVSDQPLEKKGNVANTPEQKTNVAKQVADTKGYKETSAASGVLRAADPKQTLFPSTQLLLHRHGLSSEEAFAKIKASGPKGRLLKGDILSYLEKIPQKSVVSVAEYIQKQQKLDLSGIESRPLQATDVSPAERAKTAKAEPKKPAIITEQFVFEVPNESSLVEVTEAIHNYVKVSLRDVHKMALRQNNKGVVNNLFEELLQVDPRKPRFDVSYELEPMGAVRSTKVNRSDAFDFLINDNYKKMATGAAEACKGSKRYALNLSLSLNDCYNDAPLRAKEFLKAIRGLSFFAQS